MIKTFSFPVHHQLCANRFSMIKYVYKVCEHPTRVNCEKRKRNVISGDVFCGVIYLVRTFCPEGFNVPIWSWSSSSLGQHKLIFIPRVKPIIQIVASSFECPLSLSRKHITNRKPKYFWLSSWFYIQMSTTLCLSFLYPKHLPCDNCKMCLMQLRSDKRAIIYWIWFFFV